MTNNKITRFNEPTVVIVRDYEYERDIICSFITEIREEGNYRLILVNDCGYEKEYFGTDRYSWRLRGKV